MLKNKNFWLVLAGILIVTLIIVLGILLEWSWERVILLCVFVIFIFLIILMYLRLIAVKKAQLIEDSIKKQADKNALGISAAKKEEIEQLKQKLLDAIAALKASNLGRGKRGKAALYALPWYLFIGPPGVGKTTAIERSGLDFPYGADSIKGVGGTRNCDWYFSNSAIILDTAGRYTTEDEDRDEWYAFLDTLKKYRRRRPINGVMVGISITELIEATNEQLEKHAALIRSRINELIERLGISFPVYLIFTKCDLLQGFVEFFEDFGRTECEQIWGCTMTDPQQACHDPGKVFTSEFNQLSCTLNLIRVERLSNQCSREERSKVYGFPLQFQAEKDKLSFFVSKLFHINRYKENPIFRGFYFTSGTQEGVPIDRAIQTIAREFDLPAAAIERFDPQMETKSYFIKKLFTDIIIPDQNIVNPTSRNIFRQSIYKIGSMAGIFLLLVLFIYFISNVSGHNAKNIKSIVAVTKYLEQTDWNSSPAADKLYKIDRLKASIIKIEDKPFLGGSIYQADRLTTPASILYLRKFYPFFDKNIYKGLLENRLKRYADYHTDFRRDEAVQILRAYSLLGQRKDILRNSPLEEKTLQSILSTLIDSLFTPNAIYQFDNMIDQNLYTLKPQIKEQVAYYVELLAGTKSANIQEHKSNEYLISQIQRMIGKPDVSDIYGQIKREGVGLFAPINLRQMLQGRYQKYFRHDAEISGFYSQECWQTFVKSEIERRSKNPNLEDWLIPKELYQSRFTETDENELYNKLKNIYFNEYCDNWWRFLTQIEYQPTSNMSVLADLIGALGDPNESPLLLLFKGVSEQTEFENILTTAAQNLPDNAVIKPKTHYVDLQFAPVHDLIDSEKGILSGILNQYQQLAEFLSRMAEDEDSKAAETAAQVIERGSGELPDALDNIAHPAIRRFDNIIKRNLFEKPINMAWQSILAKTQSYLNSQWREKVYREYQQYLANYYPFNPEEVTDAAIHDVIRFFSWNNGILWDYINTELKPFIRSNSYATKSWQNLGINISERTKNALKKANSITRGLGLDSDNRISLQFRVLPEEPSPRGIVDQIILVVNSEQLVYRMGVPRPQAFTWPGNTGLAGASLELSSNKYSFEPLRFDSDWGWFKLLDLAFIREVSSREYYVQWRVPPNNNFVVIIKFIIQTSSSSTPFGDEQFFQLVLPQKLN